MLCHESFVGSAETFRVCNQLHSILHLSCGKREGALCQDICSNGTDTFLCSLLALLKTELSLDSYKTVVKTVDTVVLGAFFDLQGVYQLLGINPILV